MSQKTLIIGSAALLILAAFLVWLFIASSKPLPGTKIADLGRGHVPIGEKVDYNSNPPTSGKHYAEWIRAGVYDEDKDDRNLVHSLEHGYVIMHYRCKIATSSAVIASPAESGTKQSAEADNQIATSSTTKVGTPQCEERKNQLAKVYESKGKHKLIVIPRPNLDTNFALIAWTYLDKFDEFDQARIEKFIDAHRDQGPEHTMEP